MKINAVTNATPALKNTNKNQNKSQNPNFGVNFHIKNSNAELVDQICVAINGRKDRFGHTYFTSLPIQPYFAKLMTNLANLCGPFKECLKNKDVIIYDDKNIYGCGGEGPIGIYGLKIGIKSKNEYVDDTNSNYNIFALSCKYDQRDDEMEGMVNTLKNILLKDSPDSANEINESMRKWNNVTIYPVQSDDIENDSFKMLRDFYDYVNTPKKFDETAIDLNYEPTGDELLNILFGSEDD